MDACGQVMEEVVSGAIGRQEGKEELEWAAGALSYLHLVLGDSRVLGTVSHILLCKKSQCFVYWTKSAKSLGSIEAVPAEMGGFSRVLEAEREHAGMLA